MTKGKLTRALVLLVALIMVLPLVACNSAAPAATTAPASAAPAASASAAASAAATPAAPALDNYKLRILSAGDQPPDQQSVLDAVAAQTKDTLNVNIEVDYFPWADYINKVQMMSAANEKFDIFLTFSGTDVTAYNNKQVLALDDLLNQYGPHLLKNLTASNWIWCKGPDGKTIAIPAQYAKDGVYDTLVVRKDLRVKYGLPEITSLDTLAQYLDAVVKNEKGITPLLGGAMGGVNEMENYRLYGYDWRIGYTGTNNQYIGWYATKGDNAYKVQDYYETDLAKNIIKNGAEAMNRGWYAKDLNAGQNGYDQTAISSGLVACEQMDYYNFNTIYNNTKKSNPSFELEWALVDKGEAVNPSMDNNFSQISATSAEPARAIMFLDWLETSQDNYDLWFYGIKGKHYNLSDSGGIQYIGSTDNTTLPYNPTPWWFRNYQMDRTVSTDCDMTQTAQSYYKNEKVNPLVATTAFVFDPTKVNLQITQIGTVIGQYWNDISNGVLQGDDNYNKFIKALNDAGMPDVIKEMQTQLDAYRAAHPDDK